MRYERVYWDKNIKGSKKKEILNVNNKIIRLKFNL